MSLGFVAYPKADNIMSNTYVDDVNAIREERAVEELFGSLERSLHYADWEKQDS